MYTPDIARSWTDIVAFRRRDRMTILPMTLIAAIAAAALVGPRFSVGWFAINVGFMAASKALCDWIASRRPPTFPHEAMLATFTFAMTLAYCGLPLAMIAEGSHAGVIAGMAMVGAIALSSVSEFVLSRLVGGAALTAMFLIAVAGLLWRAGGEPIVNTAFSMAAVSGFFFYVLQSGLRRERTEQQMHDAVSAAAAASAAKSAFLATMSHEIRTPLNGVLGMAQAMEGASLPDAQRERLAIIRQSGKTLTAILNDILDLSKIEAGQMELEQIEFDLEATLSGAQAAFAPLAASKGLGLTLTIDDDAAGTYLGDPTRVRQVVYNLTSNAVKFTERGDIVVAARRRYGQLELSVSDTGVGIASDQTSRLFDTFVQLDASTTRRYGGAGLGLAICRDLCGLMGGTLGVESRPGEGSVFTACLPLDRLAERHTHPAPAPSTADIETLNLRVLAAEDNPVNQLVLRTLMGQLGVEPTIVENGQQAVEAWESGDWHVILMDVQMPVMDGLTALGEIRAREAATGRARTPVIAITANAMTHQIAELRAAGMDAHVGKPIDVAQLFATLRAVLSAQEDTPSRSALGPT